MLASISCVLLFFLPLARSFPAAVTVYNPTASLTAPMLIQREVSGSLQFYSRPSFVGVEREFWVEFDRCRNFPTTVAVGSIKLPSSFYKNSITCVFYNRNDCPDGKRGVKVLIVTKNAD